MNKTISILVVILLLVGGLLYISRQSVEAPVTQTTPSELATTTEEAAAPTPSGTSKPAAKPKTSTPTTTTVPNTTTPAPGTPGVQQTFPIGSETAVPRSTGVVVTYTDQGFSPPSITIKSGTIVNFVNKSGGLMWVASNPHPVHTDYPGLDAKRAYVASETYSFTFVGAGKTFGYHNHLNTGIKGTITIQ